MKERGREKEKEMMKEEERGKIQRARERNEKKEN